MIRGARSAYRTRIGIGLVTASVMLAVAGCSASGNEQGDEDVTVTMWTFLDPASGTDGRSQALSAIIEAFESENPGIKIETQTQQWSTLTSSYLAAVAAGNEPDITWMPTNDYWAVVDQGALADITEIYSGEGAEVQEAFVDSMTKDDKVFGLPQSMGVYGVLYREDLFEAAGYDGSDLATWSSFEQVVEDLTDASNDIYGFGQAFSTTTADVQVMVPRLLQDQGNLFGEDGLPAWSTPEGQAALEYQIDFVESGLTPEAAVQWTSENTYEQLAAGRVAIVPALSTRVPVMEEQLGAENVGFALWPSYSDAEPMNAVAGWVVGVSATSDVVDAASKFVEHLSSLESDMEWVTTGGQAPVRSDTLASIDDSAPYLDTVSTGFGSGWLPPAEAIYGDYRTYLNQAAQDVLANGLGYEEALSRAEESYVGAAR